jgi:uncharacterized membrane protein YraQ (UPF0718 family)/copper chaperone CopZ
MIWLGHLFLETWNLFFQFAPYLLLGFLVSGALYVYLPKERLIRHMGRPGPASVFKAALFGIPLPLCSCGVIPAALSLRKQGASQGATVSFLISTPQTGADSIIASYSLMGGFLALMRPLFSMLTAVATGIAVNLFDRTPRQTQDCHDHAPAPPLFQTSGRFRKIFSYGLRDHLGGVYRWLLVGLVLAALVTMLLPNRIPHHRIAKGRDRESMSAALPFKSLGTRTADLVAPSPASPAGRWVREFLIGHNEFLCMLLMVAIGVPLYICATGSIPIAMSFMQAGLSPGAAFVFLMVGPATNVTTIVMAWRYLGRRTTVIYLAGIIGVGLLSGYAINHLAPHHGYLSKPAPTLLHVHEHGVAMAFGWASALAMAGAIGAVAWIDLRMGWRARFGGSATSQALTVAVDGMTCGHCKATVEAALRILPGVTHAEAHVSANRVEILLGKRPPSMAQIRDAIESAGYQVPGTPSAVTPP